MTVASKPRPGSHVEVWGPTDSGAYVLSDRYLPEGEKVHYCTHRDPRELVKLARQCDCLSICHSYDLRRWPT